MLPGTACQLSPALLSGPEVEVASVTKAGEPCSPALFRHRNLASKSGRLVVVVLREPNRPGVLLCDGDPLVAVPPGPCSAQQSPLKPGAVQPGDKFYDGESGLALICPLGGQGTLTFDGRPLQRVDEPGAGAQPAD
jgi:hypothetical protein